MVKEKQKLNVVIIGHVDSGKSTTCGHLMYLLGAIDKRLLEKYEKESEELKKGSFKYAWILDNFKAERERGITIDITTRKMETEDRDITIIDAPGHRDFVKNMITGTSQADLAILMIAGAKGEYESGISKNGQTREHAILASTIGIKYLIVCINKMDTTCENENGIFDEKRYNEVKDSINHILVNDLNFKKDNIKYVPISGFHGDNLIELSKRSPWYKGKPLTKIINESKPPKRPTNKPLRCPVSSVYKISGVGTVLSGRVETGIMKPNDKIFVCPLNKSTEVKSIEAHHVVLEKAIPGDNIGFNIKNLSTLECKKGMVVGLANNNPPKQCKSFTARIIIVNLRNEIKVKYTPTVHIHAASVACKITKILETFDKRTGKTKLKSKENEEIKTISKNDGALVVMEPIKPLCIETYKDFSPLGRFCARDSGVTVFVGLVVKICYKEAIQ